MVGYKQLRFNLQSHHPLFQWPAKILSKKLTATSPPILCEFYPDVDCRWHDPTKWLRCPVWDPVSVPVWEPVWDHVSVPVWSLSEATFPNSADPSIFETADFLPALLLTHIQNTQPHKMQVAVYLCYICTSLQFFNLKVNLIFAHLRILPISSNSPLYMIDNIEACAEHHMKQKLISKTTLESYCGIQYASISSTYSNQLVGPPVGW